MEKTFVIIKPGMVQRGLIGEVIKRFEQKGLRLAGMKMTLLNDEILTQHYAHLKDKPFFGQIKQSMCACPVILCCWEGVEAVQVVRNMTGSTNSRSAVPGTIRGDFGMSVQENIIHSSDSTEAAIEEINRFFLPEELYDYSMNLSAYLYADDEL
ncbi:nucleoside-diphosphate kinase [Parabacteroides sp. OttesenSCG-928-G21]|nr:nucleoside-diphosphate kinase [Parabacteroides sp. OttesenSCG-928-G21]